MALNLIVARDLAVLLRLGLSVSGDIYFVDGLRHCCADVTIAEFGAD